MDERAMELLCDAEDALAMLRREQAHALSWQLLLEMERLETRLVLERIDLRRKSGVAGDKDAA